MEPCSLVSVSKVLDRFTDGTPLAARLAARGRLAVRSPSMENSWRDRLEPWPVAAFCAVTLFIWTNRIWLAWTNDEDTVAEKLVWSTPITLFVIAAAVLAVVMLRGADRGSVFATGVKVFAAGTVVFWAVRAPMISLADHEVPFKVVHGVLAVVSVAAAVGAWRSVRNSAM